MKNKILTIAIGVFLSVTAALADGTWSTQATETTFRTNDLTVVDQPDLGTNAGIYMLNFWQEATNGLASASYFTGVLANSNTYTGTFIGNGAGLTNIGSANISSLGYTNIYRALLTQTGSAAPTVTVLQNTFGQNVVWLRTSVGTYVGLVGGAFNTATTFVRLGQLCSATQIAQVSAISNDYITISTYSGLPSPASLADGVLGAVMPTPIEIIVFP